MTNTSKNAEILVLSAIVVLVALNMAAAMGLVG